MSESSKPIDELIEIMRRLRSDDGCPWDREQTLDTLKKYLIEECYEVIDAIDSGEHARIEEELGDLLLQIVFQSQICSETGSFTFDDVAQHIVSKLVRRHPHVFGDVSVADADEVVRNWESIKREEKGEPESALAGVPRSMPAMDRAYEAQRKAARVGFDWEAAPSVLGKLEEEVVELRAALESGDSDAIQEELGDVLFSAVNVSRFLGHYPDEILRKNVEKFITRFRTMEIQASNDQRLLLDCTPGELDAYWTAAKGSK